MRKRTDSSGFGSLASAALTALSTVVVTASSALAGVIIARELGRSDETDGFFAAYGVFIVIVLAAQAIRIAVLPSLARARGRGQLGGELAGHAIALAVVAVPVAVVSVVGAEGLARVLTGNGSPAAESVAADTLRWIVPAALLHLFAGLAASGLAAFDDYAIAAVGYAAGSILGISLMLARVDSDGVLAVAWGMALNGIVALLVPLAALAVRAARTRMPARALRPEGPPIRSRIGSFATATTLPLALQLVYVVSLPFAAREGVGAQTSFAYAYIGAAAIVAVTASSLGLVTSVPLTRLGLDAQGSARHIVASSWLALCAVGVALGTLALVGGQLVEAVLGDAYEGDTGSEVAELIVALGPWMAVTAGVSVAFPLLFVVERTGALPWIAGAALVAQLPLAWLSQELFGLSGLAVSLALTTGAMLAGLLHVLGAFARGSRGLAVAASVVAAITVVAFTPPALVLGPLGAAIVGCVLFVALLAAIRPVGLLDSWRHLQSLR